MIGGKQRVVGIESDLLQAVRRGLEDNRIAETIEMAEINSAAMGKQLLIQRDRVSLSTDEIERQFSSGGFETVGDAIADLFDLLCC